MQISEEQHKKISTAVIQETHGELTESMIQLTKNKILNYCLVDKKFGLRDDISSRVLNNWINEEVVYVSDKLKGKNKRFNKLDNIWFNLIIETRKFGLPLKSLKLTNFSMNTTPVDNFSLLKYCALNTTLGIESDTLLLIFEHGGIYLSNTKHYTSLPKRGQLPNHLCLRIADLVTSEFKNNIIESNFSIDGFQNSQEKTVLLYFIRTSDYRSLKIQLDKNDVRLIENSTQLLENKELLQRIKETRFDNITIEIDEEHVITISI